MNICVLSMYDVSITYASFGTMEDFFIEVEVEMRLEVE